MALPSLPPSAQTLLTSPLRALGRVAGPARTHSGVARNQTTWSPTEWRPDHGGGKGTEHCFSIICSFFVNWICETFFKDCAFILGVPTIPLLPPQVNQSFTSVPSMNPATTLPGEQQKTRDVRYNDSVTDILHLKKTTTKVWHLCGNFCLLI